MLLYRRPPPGKLVAFCPDMLQWDGSGINTPRGPLRQMKCTHLQVLESGRVSVILHHATDKEFIYRRDV